MEKILYYGLFLDEESKNKVSALDKNKLDIVTKDFHVTFRYLPNSDERINDIVGKEFSLEVIGIANNGKNSGVLIQIPNELKKYYIHRYEKDGKQVPIIPHLTLSISNESKNKNTRDLDFKPLDTPIIIKGKFGYCMQKTQNDETSRYITFKKVL